MIQIILLNYNGYRDTLDCIKSLYKQTNLDFYITILDNCSDQGNFNNLVDGLDSYNLNIFDVIQWKNVELLSPGNIYLIRSELNFGFSKGNNFLLAVSRNNYDNPVFILNNDTVLNSNVLSILNSEWLKSSQCYEILVPQIRYYDFPDKIWSCGGRMDYFFRVKPFFNDESWSSMRLPSKYFVPFATGCALFGRRDELIFNENFFFGEEDIHLSIRRKSLGRFYTVCSKAIIYHKVNATIGKEFSKSLGRFYYYYFCRVFNYFEVSNGIHGYLRTFGLLIYVFLKLKLSFKLNTIVIISNFKVLLNLWRTNKYISRELFHFILKYKWAP